MTRLFIALALGMFPFATATQAYDPAISLEILGNVVEPCYQASVDAQFQSFPDLTDAGVTQEMSMAATRVIEKSRTSALLDYLHSVVEVAGADNGTEHAENMRQFLYAFAKEICVISSRAY